MKEELGKMVDDAISGKNDTTSDKNEANKDAASDIGAGEHAHGKGIYSHMSFDYGQIMKSSTLHSPSVNIGKPPHFDGKIHRLVLQDEDASNSRKTLGSCGCWSDDSYR